MKVKIEYKRGMLGGDCFKCKRKINCGKFQLVNTLPQITYILRDDLKTGSPATFVIEFDCIKYSKDI